MNASLSRRTIFFLCAAAASLLASAQQRPVVPGDLKWQAAPFAPGLESAWFVGAPDKPGLYAQRVRMAAGARIPPHTHPDERFSTVLSGTLYVGFGDSFDEKAMTAVPAGAVYVAPAGRPHYLWARDGAVEYQESGSGPTDTRFIKR